MSGRFRETPFPADFYTRFRNPAQGDRHGDPNGDPDGDLGRLPAFAADLRACRNGAEALTAPAAERHGIAAGRFWSQLGNGCGRIAALTLSRRED